MVGCYSLNNLELLRQLKEEPDDVKYVSPVYHIQPGKDVGTAVYWT